MVYFHKWPTNTHSLVYFHGRPAHTCSSWSIFRGDRPTHSHGLFSWATCPQIHSGLFSRVTCPQTKFSTRSITKKKSTKIIFLKIITKQKHKKMKKKTHVGNTVAIHSVLWGKLQCFPTWFNLTCNCNCNFQPAQY